MHSRISTIATGALRWGAAVVVLTLGVAGCGAPASVGASSVPVDPAFALQVEQAKSAAQSSGASSHQIDLLDQALGAGAVTLDIALDGEHAFFSCLDEAGISYADDGPAPYGAYPRLGYRIFAADPAPSDVCYAAEYQWIDRLYQNQPATLADIADQVMQRKEGILACLRDAGVAIDDDPTYDELHEALYFALFGFHSWDDPGNADPNAETFDCYGPVGLNPQDV